MPEKDYLVIYLTNAKCKVCIGERGNGILGNNTNFLKFDNMKRFLVSSEGDSVPGKLSLLNIHFSEPDGKIHNIVDISRFHWYPEVKRDREKKLKPRPARIEQEKYFNFKGKTRKATIFMEKEGEPKISATINITEDDSDELIDWQEYIKRFIPKKIENFSFLFAPTTVITTQMDWKKALKIPTVPFRATTTMGFVIKRDGEYMLDNTRDPRMRSVSPADMLKHIMNDTVSFEAQEFKKSEKSEKKESKIPYNIYYYDDPS